MGDPLLLRRAEAVTRFDTPELHALILDMEDTMREANGAGLAAPQIGVSQRVVIFGFERSERYPDAPPVPKTVLINPVLVPLDDEEELGWEGCLSVPGLRGAVNRWMQIRYTGIDPAGTGIEVATNSLEWWPDGASAPLVIDLHRYFDDVLDA